MFNIEFVEMQKVLGLFRYLFQKVCFKFYEVSRYLYLILCANIHLLKSNVEISPKRSVTISCGHMPPDID